MRKVLIAVPVVAVIAAVAFLVGVPLMSSGESVNEGDDSTDGGGAGHAHEAPGEWKAALSSVPELPESSRDGEGVYDGGTLAESYWIKTDAVVAVDWYVDKLTKDGWSLLGERLTQENELDRAGSVEVSRIIEAVHQLFERDGIVLEITAMNDPYKDPAKGTGLLIVTLIGDDALSAMR